MLTSHLVCCPHSCPPLEKVSLRKKCPHLPGQGKQQKVSKLLERGRHLVHNSLPR